MYLDYEIRLNYFPLCYFNIPEIIFNHPILIVLGTEDND